MYIYVYIYICIHMYIYIHTHIFVYILACIYLIIYIKQFSHAYRCIDGVYIYIYIYIVCVYIYTYTYSPILELMPPALATPRAHLRKLHLDWAPGAAGSAKAEATWDRVCPCLGALQYVNTHIYIYVYIYIHVISINRWKRSTCTYFYIYIYRKTDLDGQIDTSIDCRWLFI